MTRIAAIVAILCLFTISPLAARVGDDMNETRGDVAVGSNADPAAVMSAWKVLTDRLTGNLTRLCDLAPARDHACIAWCGTHGCGLRGSVSVPSLSAMIESDTALLCAGEAPEGPGWVDDVEHVPGTNPPVVAPPLLQHLEQAIEFADYPICKAWCAEPANKGKCGGGGK